MSPWQQFDCSIANKLAQVILKNLHTIPLKFQEDWSGSSWENCIFDFSYWFGFHGNSGNVENIEQYLHIYTW